MNPVAKNILRTYLNRLTNLTGNNRSILLLRLLAEQMIDLQEMNFLQEGGAFSIISALMAGKSKKLCSVLDSRLEANNEISRKLKKLLRIDRFIFEERGADDLHVGWPFIRGKFSDGTPVRAPLVFFPVALAQVNNHWVLQPRADVGITLNKSFLLAYSFYNKVDLKEELLDTVFDDFSADSTVWRTELYEMLKDRIELNFNPDNFGDQLLRFEDFKKSDFEKAHRDGELKLYPEAVLGIFPQAGSQLVPDYAHLLEQDFNNLEDLLVRGDDANAPAAAANTGDVKEEKLYTPFALDIWQEHAIKAVKTGKSLVVQGPPGTGKSQLICNLMADAIASGKRVLLVCQKRAALDVVYRRLQGIDLGDFLGIVHDFRNDRKEIFGKIARQIDKIEDYKARNRSVDIIQMERRFFHVSRRIDALVEELEEFKQALYDESVCDLSVKELYLSSDPYADTINLKLEYPQFRFSQKEDFLRKVSSYTRYAYRFEQPTYMWRLRKSFVSLTIADMKVILDALEDIPQYQTHIEAEINKRLPMPVKLNLEHCESFLGREDDILGMIGVLKDEETYHYFQAMSQERDDETSLLWFSNMERVVMNCYEGAGPERTLAIDELGKLQEALNERMDARSNLIRRARWELFSKDKHWLKRVLAANELEYNTQGLQAMEQRLDSRLNLEHHLTSLKDRAWLIDMPDGYDVTAFKRWFQRQKLAIRAKIIFNSLREVKDAINPQKLTRREFTTLFHDLLSVVSEIPERKATWLKHLTPYQVRNIILDPKQAAEYARYLKRDFDNLCHFDRLKESLLAHELGVINKLHDHVGAWEYEKLEKLFNNSLALAWIDYIETKYPVLRMVSSMKMDEMQEELQEYVKEKKKLSKEILLLRARERVYENLEYNRLNNRITYRDLQHQVMKKKKLWPLRKVISELQEELFRLMPCWMASPESVSAIFPMKEIFDLVIFDEASQCFSERGLPAMYRGTQVLIAGDDKQLKPYELYQVRWDEDSEQVESEIESLLDLGKRYLTSVHLRGHYRSQASELIDFSNRHFYEGRLQLLPDRDFINRNEPAIEFHKVDGYWEENANPEEAAALVDKILDLLRQYPGKELGIVTFNAPQQMLILDILEEKAMEAGIQVPASLFVKNIENVQGDEKDIIIFSIGYAPDRKGNLAMRFGSLNIAGGENRLNVAITRAREKVIIVSSLWPDQLKVDGARNAGPGLLKGYLEFALEVQQGRYKPRVYTTASDGQSAAWYLKSKLKSWGNEKFPEISFDVDMLPFSDLCFSRDSHYLGVILTDDDRYLSGPSAKDVHAYTMDHLAKKHWHHRMIYSRNFWLEREKVENDLLRLIGIGTQKG